MPTRTLRAPAAPKPLAATAVGSAPVLDRLTEPSWSATADGRTWNTRKTSHS